jgi:Fe-S oxidoreductase
MQGLIDPGRGAGLLALLLILGALIESVRVIRRWRIGGQARIAWISNILALPRRYLVDVHHIVARDPYAAKMHAAVAGGLLAGSALLPFALLDPGWFYWLLVGACFAVMIAGALMVGARRVPRRLKRLSGGRFQILPMLLLLYAIGELDIAISRDYFGLLLAAIGGVGLVLQIHTGPLRHALAGAIHLVAHPRPQRFAGQRETALAPLDLEAAQYGIEKPQDFAWNRLASFDACVQCGRCETVCPAFAAGMPLNPKKLIQDLASSIVPNSTKVTPDTLWSCTTCRACVEECPMMIEHVDAIVGLRRFQVLEQGAVPDKVAAMLAELRYADEPGGRSLAARTDFAAGLPLRVIDEKEPVDILLWLGEGAFDLRYGRSLVALGQVLRAAGQDFGVLGRAEADCGDVARRLGDEATFQRLARENIATLNRYRFTRIVTADPHAYHVLKNEYPALGGTFIVQHHTELLAELVETGRLTLRDRQDQPRVTYHDPCYLGRYNGVIDQPRTLLRKLGVEFIEMERHGMRAMCCGGGGGAPVSDVAGERRIGDIRMDQARATGAAIVAVACPGCTAMLEAVPEPRPVVKDLAELLLDALEPAA